MRWERPTTGISQGVTYLYIYLTICEGKLTANTTKVTKAELYINKANYCKSLKSNVSAIHPASKQYRQIFLFMMLFKPGTNKVYTINQR